MDYSKMNYKELRAEASSKNVYKVGMKKTEIISALHKANKLSAEAEKQPSTEPVSTPPSPSAETKDAAVPSISISEPEKEAEKPEPSKVVGFHTLDGKILEASINKLSWKGRSIEVPVEHAPEVARILREGNFLFTDVKPL